MFFLPKKPVLSSASLERLSNILDNIGQGFFVVLVLTPIVQGFDKINWGMLGLGVSYMLVCWIVSVIAANKAKEDNDSK